MEAEAVKQSAIDRWVNAAYADLAAWAEGTGYIPFVGPVTFAYEYRPSPSLLKNARSPDSAVNP